MNHWIGLLKFTLVIDSGDELLSDSFPYKEIENGILWEVEGKVCANPLLSIHQSFILCSDFYVEVCFFFCFIF